MGSIVDFLKCEFGIDNNTAATILITLLVFVTGILLNEIRKLISSIYKNFRIRQMLRGTLLEVSNSCQRQATEFQNFLPQLSPEHQGVFNLKMNAITHLDSIEKIPFENLYSSIFSYRFPINNQFRTRSFNSIFNSIALLKNMELRYPEDMKLFIEKYTAFEDQWNSNLEGLRRLVDEIVLLTNNQQVPQNLADYLQTLDQIWVNWQQLENRTSFDNVRQHLLQPLRNLNRNSQGIRFITQINNFILGAEHAYTNLTGWLTVNQEKYRSFYFNYRLISRRLRVIVRSI